MENFHVLIIICVEIKVLPEGMLVIYADFSQLGTDKFIPEPKESYGVDFVRVAMVNI